MSVFELPNKSQTAILVDAFCNKVYFFCCNDVSVQGSVNVLAMDLVIRIPRGSGMEDAEKRIEDRGREAEAAGEKVLVRMKAIFLHVD